MQMSRDINFNTLFIAKILFRAAVTRNRFLFRHFIWYASRDRKRQKMLLYNCCFWYCQSVFIINNVLCDNWNIYHVCYFLRSRFPKSSLRSTQCLFCLNVPDGFPLKKCRWLLCVCEDVCMWIIVKKEISPSKHFECFLFCWFLLTFCFLYSLISRLPPSPSHPTIFQWTSSIFYVIFHSLFYIKNIKTRKRSCSSLAHSPVALALLKRICCCLLYFFLFLLSP